MNDDRFATVSDEGAPEPAYYAVIFASQRGRHVFYERFGLRVAKVERQKSLRRREE